MIELNNPPTDNLLSQPPFTVEDGLACGRTGAKSHSVGKGEKLAVGMGYYRIEPDNLFLGASKPHGLHHFRGVIIRHRLFAFCKSNPSKDLKINLRLAQQLPILLIASIGALLGEF